MTGASTVRCYAPKQLFAVHVPRCAQLFCLSQRAIVLCNPQIMISVLGRRADCREAEISFFQVAIVFCLLQCIRHGASPKKKTAPDGMRRGNHRGPRNKTRQGDAGSQGADYDRGPGRARSRRLIDSGGHDRPVLASRRSPSNDSDTPGMS